MKIKRNIHFIEDKKLYYIKDIFFKMGIQEIVTIERVMSGQINEVYAVNNKFIVRLSSGKQDGLTFLKEYKIYKIIKEYLKIPLILFTDFSRKKIPFDVIISLKLDGKTLAHQWVFSSVKQRQFYIKQLCQELKILHNLPLSNFPFLIKNNNFSHWWPKKYKRYIEDCFKKARKDSEIDRKVVRELEKYYNNHKYVLVSESDHYVLVHADIHFENILVNDNNIFMLLDFEYSDIAPFDFELSKIINFCFTPEKFVEKKLESYYQDNHPIEILKWFKQFYPELFENEKLLERQRIFIIPDILWGYKWVYLPKIERWHKSDLRNKKLKAKEISKQLKIASKRYEDIFVNDILSKYLS
ncbi:MAG: aminoglycoside phosphotransferase family protein [Candidatus Nealsonbacteria bacterium]